MNWFWMILVLCFAINALANDNIFTKKNSGNHRVVGGRDAIFGEVPHQGLLIIQTSPFRYSLCGCSLISTEWAVTAAHCTYLKTAQQLTATFGTIYKTSSAFDSSVRQETSVSDVYEHQRYDHFTLQNDISLLRLSTPIEIDHYVAPISLPTAGDNLVGINESSCVISGWGTTQENGDISEILQRANIPLIGNSRCEDMLRKASQGSAISIHNKQVCAGYEQGGIDTCQGDSGGPLACRSTSSNESILIGVTSFGFGCARPQSPGVYARVSSYRDWIDYIMRTGDIPIFNNWTTTSTTTGEIPIFSNWTTASTITTTSIWSSTTGDIPIFNNWTTTSTTTGEIPIFNNWTTASTITTTSIWSSTTSGANINVIYSLREYMLFVVLLTFYAS